MESNWSDTYIVKNSTRMEFQPVYPVICSVFSAHIFRGRKMIICVAFFLQFLPNLHLLVLKKAAICHSTLPELGSGTKQPILNGTKQPIFKIGQNSRF